MVDDSRTAEELIRSIVEDQVDHKYPGVDPDELTGPPYYDKKREDPEAPLDKIVHDARSFRFRLQRGLTKHTMPELREEADEVWRRHLHFSLPAYEKRSEKQQFFNRPEAEADFSHWACMAYWSAEEAVALTLGKDPKRVNLVNLEECCTQVSPFIKRFKNLKELIDRAIEAEVLPKQPTPRQSVEWAKKIDFEIPTDLEEELEQLALPSAPTGGGFDEESETYPLELHIAVKAWSVASRQTDSTDTPKELVREWVTKSFPDLSKAAVERIAVVCNWEKKGGRKKEE
jgi:hypothetical protein